MAKPSIGYAFISAMVALLGSGVTYILFNQTLTNYLFNQTLVTQVVTALPYGNVTAVAETQATMVSYFTSVPIFLFIFVVLYLILNAQAGKEQ